MHAEPGRPIAEIGAVVEGDGEAGHRADQHHALDAEIEHAALLDHEFAGRGEQDRRRHADHGDEGVDEEAEIHATASAGAARGRVAKDPHAVSDQNVAGENEEQHHRLEDAGGRARHMHHRLRHLAADIGDGEDQRREKDADRMEAAEERNDDRGEAVAGGEAEVDLPELARGLENAGKPGHAAADQEGRPDRARGVEAAVARGAGRRADGADRKAVDRARREQPEHERQHEWRRRGPAECRFRQWRAAGAAAGVNGGVCGKLWPFGSFHGPLTR